MGPLLSTPLRTENNIKTLGKRIRVDVALSCPLQQQFFRQVQRVYRNNCKNIHVVPSPTPTICMREGHGPGIQTSALKI